MTATPFEQAETAASDGEAPFAFDLPTVSVVIVNYNYASYLKAAVDSVFNQTYKNVECIVLDNASTDDSASVIAALQALYPAMKTVQRQANDGQSMASLEGFLDTTGPYVCFLDADDAMLPTFLATHVFAHLSLRIPVGFTCSDMFQTSGRDLVLGAFVGLNHYVRSRAGRQDDLLRPVDTRETALPLAQLCPIPESAVHLVAADFRDWPWASMSAFVFRRDALNLVMHNPALRTLPSNFDVYLARGVNVLTGSAVLDRALTVYRMHTTNVFARHPHLNKVFNFERHGLHDREQYARRILIDNLFSTAGTLLDKLQNQGDFFRAARLLNDIEPRLMSKTRKSRTYVQEKFIGGLPLLRDRMPRLELALWSLRLRLSPLCILAAPRAEPPIVRGS